MQQKSETAIAQADAVAFILDGVAGITPFDEEIAKLLFRQNKPTIVLINKCDSKKSSLTEYDVYGLGFKTSISVSAEHNLGIDAFYQFIYPYLEKETETNENSDKNLPLKLAVMGRPNVGKSTLINSLIGDDRLLTADMPGVTRDSIVVKWKYEGQEFELTDTAGIRRKSRVLDTLENMAVSSASKTLQFAEMVVLVIDATIPLEEHLEKQDILLAHNITKEGRGLIIALNKIDKVKNLNLLIDHIRSQLNNQLSQVRDVSIVPISALKHNNLDVLLDEVLSLYKLWNIRISTPKLNDWLGFMLEQHPTPAIGGRRIRIKYITQIKSRPPTFALFCTKAAALPDSYLRYLANGLRDNFSLPGVPIRMVIKEKKNPYLDKA